MNNPKGDKAMTEKAIDRINRLIEDYDIERLGFASLRKLLISKSKIEGEVLSDDELAKRVEEIRQEKTKGGKE